jgi:hypothetical protein
MLLQAIKAAVRTQLQQEFPNVLLDSEEYEELFAERIEGRLIAWEDIADGMF